SAYKGGPRAGLGREPSLKGREPALPRRAIHNRQRSCYQPCSVPRGGAAHDHPDQEPMRRSASTAGLLLLLLAAPACAEVLVSGTRDGIKIEISDASVEEVLAALGAKFALRYRSGAPLDKRLTGTHQGSLQRVVRRVLDGYDFVVRTSGEGVDVAV